MCYDLLLFCPVQPERIDPSKAEKGYTIQSDVWSFGITLVSTNAQEMGGCYQLRVRGVASWLIQGCGQSKMGVWLVECRHGSSEEVPEE